MTTNNSWNNQVLDADVIFNGGTMSIGTDATSGAINIGTGAAARTVTVGNGTGASSVVVNTGTGNLDLGVNATAHTSRLGSTSGASATTVQCGTGALTVNGGGAMDIDLTGQIQINSSGSTIDIGNDNVNQNVNIGTSGARTVTVGSTTGASALALKCGTGDFSLASATGTVISALDTGAVTKPLQPAFSAYKSAGSTNVTGNGALYHVIFNSEFFDIGANYNTGTGYFTAPVDGIYLFRAQVELAVIAATGYLYLKLDSSSTQDKQMQYYKPTTAVNFGYEVTGIMKLSAADTVRVIIQSYGEAGNTESVNGDANGIVTNFSGILLA